MTAATVFSTVSILLMAYVAWRLNRMDQNVSDVKAAFEAYRDAETARNADLQKQLDEAKAGCAAAVAKAIADDHAERDVDLVALKSEINDALSKVTVPTPPPFNPSANG